MKRRTRGGWSPRHGKETPPESVGEPVLLPATVKLKLAGGGAPVDYPRPSPKRRMTGAICFSLVFHLSMVTLFRIMVYFPREERQFFDFRIVQAPSLEIGDLKPGPLEIGFDYNFIIPATGDRTPCVYVENHRVAGLDPRDPIQVNYAKPVGNDPTGKDHPELLKQLPNAQHAQTIVNGISRIGYMSGGKSARWVDEKMADVITRKAVDFIVQNQAQPFFLYFATHDIHAPRVPHPRFAGRSPMGPRGDVILQFDACVGEIVTTLDRLRIAENTLVIVTSDNGPVVEEGYRDGSTEKLGNHQPAGPWRGGKYSIWEGGTRIPFILRWPARVKSGTSEALVCQIDFLASLASLTSQPLAPGEAPDSLDILPALLGESPRGRRRLVEHAQTLALREEAWKYIGALKEIGSQLYDLASDPGETNNVASRHPEKAGLLRDQLNGLQKGSATPLRN